MNDFRAKLTRTRRHLIVRWHTKNSADAFKTAENRGANRDMKARNWTCGRHYKLLTSHHLNCGQLIEEETDRREGKGRRCYLAARKNWRTVIGWTSILGGWWFGVVWTTDDHPLFWSIHSAKRPLFNWSFSSNDPGVKSVVWRGIEWIPSPKQQRRP